MVTTKQKPGVEPQKTNKMGNRTYHHKNCQSIKIG